ncbi:mitochondrial 37S ribosomal protein nam9 [Actinomortierella ambigua]|uniref:Mitochondrial 37S ribosomal protein nam9 n=1 Tax=Actinomortierella ambigua TaxID=1343610 RepID=A0A9P6PXQ0_9FUNG|nr:mitochondrial 37S ribosomal protein nam9 [Actinomortierella ambigua]KAG0254315.1 mitochondrial 37S ribosomal protein nam9 [Actinomortierella ambigua]
MRNTKIPAYSLRRQMIRMSWNKYNLYNMAQRTRALNSANKTLYQQKWASKKDTRAYHGDQITERQFQSMFDTRLPTANTKVGADEPHPPVFSLTFAELERRLDFILFRSNLAPSVYAARQLVGHGKVKINGKAMPFPSHRVADGDIVSVEPKAVSTLKKVAAPKEGEAELTGKEPMDFVPHKFSQPFLFVPDYLEVNYNTCSVCFLRSPISRPGKTEIPSPFAPQVHQLAYEFYARNRK